MTMNYGDKYLDAITDAYAETARKTSGGRHARPKKQRRVPSVVRRMAFWTLVFGIVWALGAVYLVVRPPVFHLDMVPDGPPAPTAHVTHIVHG